MADHEEHRSFEYERVTAPMQEYSTRAVVIGTLVALVGLAVVFGLPLALL